MKKMKGALSLLVALGILMSFIPGAFAQSNQTAWTFDNTSDAWQSTKGNITVTSGIMTYEITGTNSSLAVSTSENLTIDGSKLGMIHIRMKNNTAGHRIGVQWLTEKSTNWSDNERYFVTSYDYAGNDTDFKDYYIDLSGDSNWKGNIITALQLYLTAFSTSSGTVEIDTIEFIEAADECKIAGFSDKLIYSTANIIQLGLDTNLANILSAEYFVNNSIKGSVTTSPFGLNASFEANNYIVGAKVTTDKGIFITVPKSFTVHNAGKNRWTFDGDETDTLTPVNSDRCTLKQNNGVLTVDVVANKGAIGLTSTSFGSTSSADYDYFKIKMKNNTAKNAQLQFWARPVNGSFDQTYRFDYTPLSVNDTQFKEYIIDLSKDADWNLDFYQIRVDPVSGFTADSNGKEAAFEIESMSLEADPQITINEIKTTKEAVEGTAVTITADAADFDNNIKSVEFFEDGKSVGTDNTYPYAITYIPSSSGKKVITAVATDETDHTATSDSVIMNIASDINTVVTNISTQWNFNIKDDSENFTVEAAKGSIKQNNGNLEYSIAATNGSLWTPDNLGIDGTKYPYIHIRLKNNSAGTSHKIYWTTTDNTAFSETLMLTSANVTAQDDDFVEYVYDLSEQWKNETIKRLRFAPAANASTGSVEIDYIKICDQPVIYYANNTINIEKESSNKIKATVTLNQTASESGNIYIAHYVDEVLENISLKPFNSTKNIRNIETISLSSESMKAGDKIKVFVLNNNLKPLLEASGITFSE